jgi:hypothetical protein
MSRLHLAVAAVALLAAGAAGAAIADDPVRLHVPDSRSGAFERSDHRLNGRYQDRYILDGRAGDELEIRATGEDFGVTATLQGNGVRQSSQMDWANVAVIRVDLPIDGAYEITVTAPRAGLLGGYVLTVEERCDPPNYLDANGECAAPT